MAQTQCQELADRFERMAAGGLVDVKFFVGNAEEADTEQVCREVNELYLAVERGEITALDFKDTYRA